MLRNRSDQFGKNLLRDLLALGGDPRTEEEVPPGDAQRIDVWFVPDDARRHVLVQMKGIIAKMAEKAAMIELWSQPFRVRAFHKCMRKLYDWHHMLELRDKLRWRLPMLWHLCATSPEGLFKEFSFDPVPGQPPGTYRLRDKGFPVFVVVIREPPRTRETLLLRLLGGPADRLVATTDLKNLEPEAVEHRVAYEWLVRLYSDLKKVDPAKLAEGEQEFVMGAWLEERDRKMVEGAVASAVASAVAKTQRETRRETRCEARVELLRLQLKMRLGRELAKSELAVLRKRVSQEKSAERLFAIASQWTATELTAWLSSTGK